jgi:hypothetical protein
MIISACAQVVLVVLPATIRSAPQVHRTPKATLRQRGQAFHFFVGVKIGE